MVWEEKNIFLLIYSPIAFWRKQSRKRRNALCPQNKAGHFTARLHRPLKVLLIIAMLISIAYLTIFAVQIVPIAWWGIAVAILASVLILLGIYLFRIAYTITETELIIRKLRTRHVAFLDLKYTEPKVRKERKIQFELDDLTRVTLRRLNFMTGHVHFVMRLSQATKHNLTEPYLGVKNTDVNGIAASPPQI